MKIIANILLFLFLAFNAYAGGGAVGLMVASGVATSAADPYATCSAGYKLFDWDCSTGSMSSNICSLGDTSASAPEGEADLTTNAGWVTCVDTSDNGNDNYKFSTNAYDIFPAGALTLEMTINFTVAGNTAELFSVFFDSNNYFDVRITTTYDIAVRHRGAGATLVSKTFDTNLSTSTNYSLILKIDTVNGMALSTNGGSSYTTDDTMDITPMNHSGTGTDVLVVGNNAAINFEGKIDNVRISAGWRTDI